MNIGGLDWKAIQGNHWRITFDLDQNATTGQLSGRAQAKNPDDDPFDGHLDPNVSKVSGDSVFMRVIWNNKARSVGIYSGNLNPQRKLVGTTFDEAHLEQQATWVSDRSF